MCLNCYRKKVCGFTGYILNISRERAMAVIYKKAIKRFSSIYIKRA